MEGTREQIFSKLLTKTRRLGRQVVAQEMLDDPEMPDPNNYAYYYGSFREAAAHAWSLVSQNGEFIDVAQYMWTAAEREVTKTIVKTDHNQPASRWNWSIKGVDKTSKKQNANLDPERTGEVIAEFVEMYIGNDGRMPSAREIKKNQYISEQEVQILRKNGELTEAKIRKIAEEQTGWKFPTFDERRREIMRKNTQEEMQATANEETKVAESISEFVESLINEQEEVEAMMNEKNLKRRSNEDYVGLLKDACVKAGHVLTQSEVKKLAETSDFPGWATLQRNVGNWWEWGTKFGLPFANEKAAQIAEQRKRENAPKEVVSEIVRATPEVSVPEIPAPEIPAVMEVPGMLGMVELPIKILVPKCVKGTISLALELRL